METESARRGSARRCSSVGGGEATRRPGCVEPAHPGRRVILPAPAAPPRNLGRHSAMVGAGGPAAPSRTIPGPGTTPRTTPAAAALPATAATPPRRSSARNAGKRRRSTSQDDPGSTIYPKARLWHGPTRPVGVALAPAAAAPANAGTSHPDPARQGPRRRLHPSCATARGPQLLARCDRSGPAPLRPCRRSRGAADLFALPLALPAWMARGIEGPHRPEGGLGATRRAAGTGTRRRVSAERYRTYL